MSRRELKHMRRILWGKETISKQRKATGPTTTEHLGSTLATTTTSSPTKTDKPAETTEHAEHTLWYSLSDLDDSERYQNLIFDVRHLNECQSSLTPSIATDPDITARLLTLWKSEDEHTKRVRAEQARQLQAALLVRPSS